MVQAAHAAHEVAVQFDCKNIKVSSLVLIGVPDERALIQEHLRLTDAGILHHTFREPDMEGAMTALATVPITGDNRRLFKRHTLWQPRAS